MAYHVRAAMVGASSRQGATYLLAAGGLTVATALAVRVVSIVGVLFLFFLSLIAAGLQARSSGGLLPSWLLGLSVPVGIGLALPGLVSTSRSGPGDYGDILVLGLFVGTLFHVIGIEGARHLEEEPRRRTRGERYGTLGLLLVVTGLFAVSGLWRLFAPTGVLR